MYKALKGPNKDLWSPSWSLSHTVNVEDVQLFSGRTRWNSLRIWSFVVCKVDHSIRQVSEWLQKTPGIMHKVVWIWYDCCLSLYIDTLSSGCTLKFSPTLFLNFSNLSVVENCQTKFIFCYLNHWSERASLPCASCAFYCHTFCLYVLSTSSYDFKIAVLTNRIWNYTAENN